jgi:hypothetical protein
MITDKMNFENEHLTRQMDLIPSQVLGEQIHIIGAGAIGSWTTLALAKMGFAKITVFDHDAVDMVNMNSQFYGLEDINFPKAGALRDRILDMTGTQIDAVVDKYTGGKLSGIVIAAVDSMEVRKTIWENQIENPRCRLVIDARMGAETALLYAMNPNKRDDIEGYPNSLYSDKDAVQERCTAKATAYTALMLSGLVCKVVKDALCSPGQMPRSVQWAIRENDFSCFKSIGPR